MIDRAAKRFGSAKVKDGPSKNEQKAESVEKKEGPASSDKGSSGAGAKTEGKTVEMKPNASGATVEAESPHAQMYGRHAEELKAMQGRHMQEIKDMHGRHADEMTQMHGRHATEVGAGATAHEGPSLPSAKAAAGKGWKTREKGKGGTESKKDGGK